MTCECFGTWKIKWLHLQEPRDAGQAAGWGERPRFLHGVFPGGDGRDTCNKGKNLPKYAIFDLNSEPV